MENMIHNQVVDAILERRSIRNYTNEKLTQKEINTIVQCGLWAPSAMNQQTTRMAVVQDTDLIHELAEDAGCRGFDYGAPCFILFYALKNNKWGTSNAALAVENATIAAHSLGLGSVVIGCVYDYLNTNEGAEKWQDKLGIPKEYEFVLGLLVGHTEEKPEPKARNQENIIWK